MPSFAVQLPGMWVKPWAMSSLTVPVFTLQVWKGFAGLFLAWKEKPLQKGSLLFFPAGIAPLWLMPCHFQPLNQKMSLGAGDSPLGQQNLGADGEHGDDLSHRDPLHQKHQEEKVRRERKVLKTIKKYKLTPAVRPSVTIHQLRRMLCLTPEPPAPRAFLFRSSTLCFCLPQ